MSEVLVLGISDSNGNIVLIKPDNEVPLGAKLHWKKKIQKWEQKRKLDSYILYSF